MKFLNYLNEEYVTLATGAKSALDMFGNFTTTKDNWAYEIFKNPTPKEIKTANEGLYKGIVRFIIDFEKKVLYVFNSDLLHYLALGILKKENIIPRLLPHIVTGSAKVESNGKLKMNWSDMGATFKYRHFKWMDSDDTWLNKWFDEPFIENYVKVLGIERI